MAGRNRIPMTSGVGMAGSSNIINSGTECNNCGFKDKGYIASCTQCMDESQKNKDEGEFTQEQINLIRKGHKEALRGETVPLRGI